ncbi:MAG: hypothetical protein F4Y47_22290 [Acidobacteriia bacterium]|nr:hypothetical protein [Terriglobia bacterium]MYK09355.1 hypothetical protein [Terriglobia bacterium]
MRLALLLAVLAGCTSGTDGVPSETGEADQSVWMPYSYRAVFDEDGVQTGWMLAQFRLDMGAPASYKAEDGTVEIPLDFEIERREIRMDLDWIPPDDLEQSDPETEVEDAEERTR